MLLFVDALSPLYFCISLLYLYFFTVTVISFIAVIKCLISACNWIEMNWIELNYGRHNHFFVFLNRINFNTNYNVSIFRNLLKWLVDMKGNDAVWWRRWVPPEVLNIRSIFQVWLPRNLPFLLHIMIASNLICPKLLWRYIEIMSTLFYFGLSYSVHLTLPHVLCSSVWNYACMPIRL